MLFDVSEHTGYSLFEDPERSRNSLFECQSAQGTHNNLSGFPECSGYSNVEFRERSVFSNNEYPVCSRTSNNDVFGDFQLLIVKNCDFFSSESSA